MMRADRKCHSSFLPIYALMTFAGSLIKQEKTPGADNFLTGGLAMHTVTHLLQ